MQDRVPGEGLGPGRPRSEGAGVESGGIWSMRGEEQVAGSGRGGGRPCQKAGLGPGVAGAQESFELGPDKVSSAFYEEFPPSPFRPLQNHSLRQAAGHAAGGVPLLS